MEEDPEDGFPWTPEGTAALLEANQRYLDAWLKSAARDHSQGGEG